jgi:hypothetical protein
LRVLINPSGQGSTLRRSTHGSPLPQKATDRPEALVVETLDGEFFPATFQAATPTEGAQPGTVPGSRVWVRMLRASAA